MTKSKHTIYAVVNIACIVVIWVSISLALQALLSITSNFAMISVWVVSLVLAGAFVDRVFSRLSNALVERLVRSFK
jgi:hypothetical protein